MIMTEQRKRVLSELCPTMFAGIGGHRLIAMKGPRGGIVGYQVNDVSVTPEIVKALMRGGLVDIYGEITERGVLLYQDTLAGGG